MSHDLTRSIAMALTRSGRRAIEAAAKRERAWLRLVTVLGPGLDEDVQAEVERRREWFCKRGNGWTDADLAAIESVYEDATRGHFR